MLLSPRNLAAALTGFALASTELVISYLLGEPQTVRVIVADFLKIAVSTGLIARLVGYLVGRLAVGDTPI